MMPLLLIIATFVVESEQQSTSAQRQANIGLSCAAYARIQTADYPEAATAMDQGGWLRFDDPEGEEFQGLRWTYRAFFSAYLIAGPALEVIEGQPLTNGEILDEILAWERVLAESSFEDRQAVRENCTPVYDAADARCAPNNCSPLIPSR